MLAALAPPASADGVRRSLTLPRVGGTPATARASFYFYNTKAEVDRFIEVVREIQKFFGA